MKLDVAKVCAGLIIILAVLMCQGMATETTWRFSGFELYGYDINFTDHNASNILNLDAVDIDVSSLEVVTATFTGDSNFTDHNASNIYLLDADYLYGDGSNITGLAAGSQGANGSYSMYLLNESGTYYAYSSNGTAVYSGSSAWAIFNQSYNTSGATYIYLAAGTNILDIPEASNNLPPITIVGEDWKLNTLGVVNPSVNFLGGQPGTTLINLAIQDAFSDDPAYPAGSVRPLKYWSNTGRTTSEAVGNWGHEAFMLLGGDDGVDNPIAAIINSGCGDSLYIQLKDDSLNSTGSGIRIDTRNHNHNPLLFFNQIGTHSYAPYLRMNISVQTDMNVMEMNVAGIAAPSWKIDSAGQTVQYISGAGFTLRAPNGNYHCITINNEGALIESSGICADIDML